MCSGWLYAVNYLDKKPCFCPFPDIFIVRRFTGPVAHYRMEKKEVKEQGLMTLSVSDEYLKSCKVENVLFRIWFQVQEKTPVK